MLQKASHSDWLFLYSLFLNFKFSLHNFNESERAARLQLVTWPDGFIYSEQANELTLSGALPITLSSLAG